MDGLNRFYALVKLQILRRSPTMALVSDCTPSVRRLRIDGSGMLTKFGERLCLTICALAFSGAARGDWEGTLHITTHARSSATSRSEDDAKIRARKAKVRIDVDRELTKVGKTYSIYDFETGIAYTVIPKLKIYVEENASDSSSDGQHDMPGGCAGGGIDACLVSQGFHKVRADSVEGRACTVWERQRWTHSGRTQQTIWVLSRAADVVVVKQIITSRVSRTVILNDYKVAPQADVLFKVPDGFARMTKSEALPIIGPVYRANPD